MGGFKKGMSGNPAGRRPGVPDRRTELTRALGERAHDVINKVLERALEGDMVAARMVLDRIAPPLRAVDLPASLALPKEGGLTARGEVILSAMAASDANVMLAALVAQGRLVEFAEFAQRIQVLEERNGITR
jgi:Family of unknown function (DUF5681)